MLVKWNGDGMCVVTPVDPTEKDTVKANLVGQVKLFPGWNEVPDTIWDLCKLHMAFLIEKGQIEELSKKGEPTPEGLETYVGVQFNDYASRNPTKGAEMVKNCFNVDVLRKWLEGNSREDIRAVLQNQIEHCLKGEETEEE